jgi:hypothetical protein
MVSQPLRWFEDEKNPHPFLKAYARGKLLRRDRKDWYDQGLETSIVTTRQGSMPKQLEARTKIPTEAAFFLPCAPQPI